MECMATSDNVIRAGLTPKLRDIPNLVSGLTYIAGDPSKHVVKPTTFSTHSKLYDPPIPEFAVIQTQLGPAEKDEHRAVEGPSIAAVVDGAGTLRWADGHLDVAMGDVVYLGADTPITLDAFESGLTLYRAFVEV
jgi:mannose-6-phosphate isomerase